MPGGRIMPGISFHVVQEMAGPTTLDVTDAPCILAKAFVRKAERTSFASVLILRATPPPAQAYSGQSLSFVQTLVGVGLSELE